MRTFAQKPQATQQTKTTKSTKVGRALSGQSRVVHSRLYLQRMNGNQALQRLLQSKTEDLEVSSVSNASTGFAHDFSRIPVHTSARSNIQPKLRVNAPGDMYEQEAERISNQVMRMPDSQLQGACACGGKCPKCQAEPLDREQKPLRTKRVRADEAEEPVTPPTIHEALHSSGQPLDSVARAFFEPRFGHDFSQVRVHGNAQATDSARSVNARAFTVGRSIVFRAGEYSAETTKGKHLLAHELVHVLQQRGLQGPSQQPPSGVLQSQEDIYQEFVEREHIDKATSDAVELMSTARDRLAHLRDVLSAGGTVEEDIYDPGEDEIALRAVERWLHVNLQRNGRLVFLRVLNQAISHIEKNLQINSIPEIRPQICQRGGYAWSLPGDPRRIIKYCDLFFPPHVGPLCRRDVTIHERFHLIGLKRHAVATFGSVFSVQNMVELVRDTAGQPDGNCAAGR